jgi:hypothetical protein
MALADEWPFKPPEDKCNFFWSRLIISEMGELESLAVPITKKQVRRAAVA